VYSRGGHAAAQRITQVVFQQVHIQQPRHYRYGYRKHHHRRQYISPAALHARWPVGLSQVGQGRER
jgi:hypothetical protein